MRIDWRSPIFDLTSQFLDTGHDVTSRRKMLPPGEWTRSVWSAPMQQRRQFLICSTLNSFHTCFVTVLFDILYNLNRLDEQLTSFVQLLVSSFSNNSRRLWRISILLNRKAISLLSLYPWVFWSFTPGSTLILFILQIVSPQTVLVPFWTDFTELLTTR